jgi:hypothetical protein
MKRERIRSRIPGDYSGSTEVLVVMALLAIGSVIFYSPQLEHLRKSVAGGTPIVMIATAQ